MSGLAPSGKNSGSIKLAVKSKVIKGTPLINSINITHKRLITGILDFLPKAKAMLKGNARAIPVTPKNNVTKSPPHLLVPTVVKLGPP